MKLKVFFSGLILLVLGFRVDGSLELPLGVIIPVKRLSNGCFEAVGFNEPIGNSDLSKLEYRIGVRLDEFGCYFNNTSTLLTCGDEEINVDATLLDTSLNPVRENFKVSDAFVVMGQTVFIDNL